MAVSIPSLQFRIADVRFIHCSVKSDYSTRSPVLAQACQNPPSTFAIEANRFVYVT